MILKKIAYNFFKFEYRLENNGSFKICTKSTIFCRKNDFVLILKQIDRIDSTIDCCLHLKTGKFICFPEHSSDLQDIA